MKRFIVFAIILSVFACSTNQEAEFSLTNHIPDDTEAIILTPNLPEFIENLKNNSFIKESKFGLQERLSSQLQFIKHLNLRSKTGINLSRISSETMVYTITTKKDSALVVLDSLQNKSVETLKEDGVELQRIAIEDDKFFLYETGTTSIISNSKTKILDIAQRKNLLKSETFKNAYNAADPNKTSVFLRNSAFKKITGLFENFNFPGFRNFSEWSILDLDITKSEMKLNGISLPGNNSFMNLLSGVNPKEAEVAKVCPSDFLSFYSVNFSSFDSLEKNLNNYSKDSIAREFPEILQYVRELASIKLKSGNLFVLNAVEIEIAKENLAGLGVEVENYRNTPIFELENPGIFKNPIPELMLIKENRFYGIVDHFIIFSNEIDPLKKAIADYQNSNTIAGKSYYSELTSSLSSASSILMVSRLPEFYASLDKSPASEKLSFKKNSLAAFQIISEDNFAHLHGIFSNSEGQKMNGSGAEQTAYFKLDAPVNLTPYFFKNHETDQMDMAVQDEKNTLYLISNKGTVFWKKKLDSQITGEIHEVDLFKNGNKQLAFSTGYQLEVLDRNGNSVKPFPVKFNEALTQPLAVFDYDNNRTYRFVLTQNKRVYMLGPKGKSIKGFDFENAKANIVKAPKHIRLGSKDYILIAEESGRLNILSRQGSIRVPVNENFNYSENEWYGYDGKFISSEPDSNLISVTQSGAVSRKNLGLADNHRVVANDDLLVYLNENELSINDKRLSLDFGLYTDPQLFEIGRNAYIAITDLQAQKVYVFDINAELLPGFPVYGTSKVDIANADLDSKLELIVKGEENEILLYEF
ncbi:hypothetical protein [Christiangramia sediminis]|uniref:Uncharacterized protein n=1 Tax=Christiangramia sediminis TaxID=2881336 RepID=A0A9X1LJI9_9FLAO|nr:hypothetical protein [Christiangramia sediminis]MCB7481479.1 hypothetical protein [Christiangramia sediminis]